MELIGLRVLSGIVFSLVVYGLAFLFADAHIFGCDASSFKKDEKWDDVKHIGMIPLRPLVLRFRFFRELLKCYFCIGVWCGLLVHPLLWHFFGQGYFLCHPNKPLAWFEGLVLSALVSAPTCYIINLNVQWFEKRQTQELFVDDDEHS